MILWQEIESYAHGKDEIIRGMHIAHMKKMKTRSKERRHNYILKTGGLVSKK